MKTRTATLVMAASLALLAFPALAAPPLAERLPGDTLVYVGWAGKTPALDDSTFGQLLKEPAAEKVLGAIKEAILQNVPKEGPAKTIFEKAWAMGAIAWQRPIALALVDLAQEQKTIRGPEGDMTVPVVMPSAALLVDLGKDRAAFDQELNALIASLGKDVPLSDASEGPVKYKVIEGGGGSVHVCYGYMGDVFFACVGKSTVKRLVEQDAAASLKSNAKAAERFKAVGGDNEQMSLYVDVTALLEKVKKLEGPREGKMEEVQRVIDALGVGKVTAIAESVRIVDKGMYSRTRIFSKAPHQGVLTLLAGGALTDADLAAVPEDADFLLAFKLSPKAVYDELRRVVKQLDPKGDDELGRHIAEAEKDLGISITNDLLANLGDTWVLSSAPSQGGFITGTLLTVQVKDAAKLSAAAEKIEGFFRGMLATREEPAGLTPRMRRHGSVNFEKLKCGDAEIRYVAISVGPIPVAPAWAIYKDKLYVAAWPQVIQSAIENPSKPITQDATFRALRAKVAGKPVLLSYVNTPKVLRQAYNLLLLGWTAAANELHRSSPVPAKPDWLPTLTKLEKYLQPEIGAVSADDEGITFENHSSLPTLGASLLSPVIPLSAAAVVPWFAGSREPARGTAVEAVPRR